MSTDTKHIQPNNPTDEERHEMIRRALEEANHVEDFENIIELLGPPKDITTIGSLGEGKGVKVGIIGGGLAGMSSAFELRKLGFDTTIFEMQEKRIGGRIYTYYFDKDKKLYGEIGAMRIPVSHETTWHYINLFDIKTSPFIQTSEDTFVYVRNKRAQNDAQGKSVMEKIYPEFNLAPWERNVSWQNLMEYALRPALLKLDPNIRKELLQIKEQYSPQIEYLDSLSIRKVLEDMGLSNGAIELISNVYPIIGALYYNSYFEILQQEYTVDAYYRYKIEGGSVNLPLAFYKSLTSKNPKDYPNIPEKYLGTVEWKNGKTVTSIYKGYNDKVIIEYTDKKHSKSLCETFDFAICTIPFSSLRNVKIDPMFSTEKMQAIREVSYTSSQKTLFMCNKRFWEKGAKGKIVEGGSYTDLPISTIWYPGYKNSDNANMKNKKDSYDNYGVLLASYNLGQDAVRLGNIDSRPRINTIKRQVEEVQGLSRGYLDPIVEDFKTVQWDKEQGFYGGFCYFMPQQQRLFSHAIVKPEYENRVYFAGEHASPVHAWIQGAVNSGMKAANSIAEYYKGCNKNKYTI